MSATARAKSRSTKILAPDAGATTARVHLDWPGKFDAQGRRRTWKIAAAQSVCCDAEPIVNAGSGGRLIHADFREALATVADASVDFVYVDPPFGTGRPQTARSGAGEATYQDQRSEIEQIELLDDLIAIGHRILKHTGSMALHVDHRCAAHARLLLDEHFGPARFINELIWHYGLGNARASRYFLRKHDNILVYGRSADYFFNRQRGAVTDAQQKKYCHEDEHGRYMLSYGKKYYLKGGKPLDSVLEIPALSATDKQRCGYPTQKPVSLLTTLIEALCPPGGLVVDPCAGSGTTAVAAHRSGRRWLICDESQRAVDLQQQRLAAESGCTYEVQRVGQEE